MPALSLFIWCIHFTSRRGKMQQLILCMYQTISEDIKVKLFAKAKTFMLFFAANCPKN